MAFDVLKRFLSDQPVPTRVLRGPFRGARVVMNPRHSMRKVLGLYEHELNSWLEKAMRRVARVVDVGANDGYFTFGAAAAFRRLGKTGEFIAIEPQLRHVDILRESIAVQHWHGARFQIVHAFAGRSVGDDMVTLDSLQVADRQNTLVKIDVEGAELEVMEGAHSWMAPSNLFMIEVHQQESFDRLSELAGQYGHELVQVIQRPLKLIGGEVRDPSNGWLVSQLSTIR
jgi:hypothetical protein